MCVCVPTSFFFLIAWVLPILCELAFGGRKGGLSMREIGKVWGCKLSILSPVFAQSITCKRCLTASIVIRWLHCCWLLVLLFGCLYCYLVAFVRYVSIVILLPAIKLFVVAIEQFV